MYTINSVVAGYSDIPDRALRYKINKYLLTNNPAAPSVGEYYVQLGRKFKIKPEFAAAQAIHETGFFKFGGQVSPDWHNPAGLRCVHPVYGEYWLKFYALQDNCSVRGGTQEVPYSCWYVGIHAHYERLSAYIYGNPQGGDYGRFDECYDPWRHRWLVERFGRSDRVIDIAFLWQGTTTTEEAARSYAESVVRHMNAIAAVEVPKGELPIYEGVLHFVRNNWVLLTLGAVGVSGGVYAWYRLRR